MFPTGAFQGMGELEGKYVGTKLSRAPKDMEPISQMTARANAWWCEAVVPWIKAQNAGRGIAEGPRDVLVVSHGGLIGVLLRALRKETVQLEKGVRLTGCMNASITVIEVDSVSARGRISRYSDISHLEGPVVEENVDVQDIDAPVNT